MILGSQVEWALHSVSVLAALPEGKVLPAHVLAELYELPKAYLAKALQALAKAGLVETTPGPRGGYRLSKPAHAITFLDVVEALEGKEPSFRCAEIRQRGPCFSDEFAIGGPCLIARNMRQADEAWRETLRARTFAELQDELASSLPPEQLRRIQDWLLVRLRDA